MQCTVARLVMMGNEGSLRSIVDKIRDSIEGAFPADVIALDMESDSEVAFHAAVQKAWELSGHFDAFLNSYTYQGLICFLFFTTLPLMLLCVDHSFIQQSFFLAGKVQDILQVSQDEFHRITKINLTAPWFLLKAVATRMKDHGSGGSIVFMATIASGERALYPGADAYASTSAAIHQLVRVCILAPN